MISLFLLLTFSVCLVQGQDMNPVEWKVEKLSETDTEVEISFTADIKTGWSIYSQTTGDDGPIPTSFEFEPDAGFELIGNVRETTEVSTSYDELFETEVSKMKGKAVFVQKIKKNKEGSKLAGTITYMCCDSNRCLPPKDVDFSLDL